MISLHLYVLFWAPPAEPVGPKNPVAAILAVNYEHHSWLNPGFIHGNRVAEKASYGDGSVT